MTPNQIKNITGITIIVVLAILLMFQCNGRKEAEQTTANYEALQDTLHKTRNKNGELTVTISTLQDESYAALLMLKSNDSTVAWLKREVQKHKDLLKAKGSSVTVIGSTTTFTDNIGTIVIFKDSIRGDTIYPTYTAKSRDTTWIKYDVTMNRKSTEIKLTVKDKYSVILGDEREKWYKPRKPVALVTSSNPYTNITEMRAFQVVDKTKPKRIAIGLHVGYGMTIYGLSPVVSVGVNFDAIRIW